MKLKPLSDRVLVKRIEAKEEVRGGIMNPDTAKDKPQEAEAVAVGAGRNGVLDRWYAHALELTPGPCPGAR